jgi:hypothetical protein
MFPFGLPKPGTEDKMLKVYLPKLILPGLSFFLLIGFAQTAFSMGQTGDVLRMTKEQLKPLLGNPDVIILDVRTGDEWKESQSKIQGARREDPTKGIQSWAKKYPPDKTLILYCS